MKRVCGQVKVVDGEGRIVPVGEPGELCFRGYCNFLGYWGDEEKTKEIVGQDRWLRSGLVMYSRPSVRVPRQPVASLSYSSWY